ncbi:DUF5378 family protein [Mycoplasmopsis opalescens]|uniref:DUF5378 family protein n=1 Tax=Mycoplasmopsis opalescens TaxID=114886 RepID=UPI0004A6C4E8|nr:DUF5378 family protein [Mycoplasmopsis opalescens]
MSFFYDHSKKVKIICWQIVGIFFLSYLIYFRFFNDWVKLINYATNLDWSKIKTPDYNHSTIFSSALLLDMCPFMAIVLSLLFIFDYKGKISSFFAPYCIFGGVLTVNFVRFSEPNIPFNLHYFFVGTTINPLYFFMHWYLMVFGILAFRRNKNPNYFDLVYLHLIAILYFSYVLIISSDFKVSYNITGIREYDWNPGGEYEGVSMIFNNKVSYPWIMIIGFTFVWFIIVSMWILRVLYTKNADKISKIFKTKKNIEKKLQY